MNRVGMTLNQKFYVGSMENLMNVLKKDTEENLKESVEYTPFISFVTDIEQEDGEYDDAVIDVDFLVSAMCEET